MEKPEYRNGYRWTILRWSQESTSHSLTVFNCVRTGNDHEGLETDMNMHAPMHTHAHWHMCWQTHPSKLQSLKAQVCWHCSTSWSFLEPSCFTACPHFRGQVRFNLTRNMSTHWKFRVDGDTMQMSAAHHIWQEMNCGWYEHDATLQTKNSCSHLHSGKRHLGSTIIDSVTHLRWNTEEWQIDTGRQPQFSNARSTILITELAYKDACSESLPLLILCLSPLSL